ncbi:MAG: anaerobic ribonucleoside-triphosphate reductase activating protein, partial [Bacteroidia bacterium]|nr:anaerobic ribonucleoside-triphosphate reductase activating protein [Bacteroidia bacterium]
MFAAKPIYNITPFTLLDYPDKTACILWFAGCNMRCVYCYNPDIVDGEGKLAIEDVITFLKKRTNLIDAVVLSGGECTRYKGISELAHTIKELGMLVKIDTNGTETETIKQLIDNQLVDYIALDLKALETDFYTITQSKLFQRFNKTLDHLIRIKFPFEIRTTYHSELTGKDSLNKMIDFIYEKGYRGNY